MAQLECGGGYVEPVTITEDSSVVGLSNCDVCGPVGYVAIQDQAASIEREGVMFGLTEVEPWVKLFQADGGAGNTGFMKLCAYYGGESGMSCIVGSEPQWDETHTYVRGCCSTTDWNGRADVRLSIDRWSDDSDSLEIVVEAPDGYCVPYSLSYGGNSDTYYDIYE